MATLKIHELTSKERQLYDGLFKNVSNWCRAISPVAPVVLFFLLVSNFLSADKSWIGLALVILKFVLIGLSQYDLPHWLTKLLLKIKTKIRKTKKIS